MGSLQVWTWELLHILFSHIEVSKEAADSSGGTGGGGGGGAEADMDAEERASSEAGPAAKKRRALLSCWFRVRCPPVATCLRQRAPPRCVHRTAWGVWR